jgi:hypothetical protein
LDFLGAVFVLADLANAELVDLLADLTLGALALADLVLPASDLDLFLLPSTSVFAEAPGMLLPFFDASTTIISPFLVLFFSDPFTLRDFVDFVD